MTPHRRFLVATAPLLAFALASTTTPALAAGSRTGATRAAKRQTIACECAAGKVDQRLTATAASDRT
jgi:hypothetical protein